MASVKAFDDSFGSVSACRTCGARIVWAELISGKKHPFNAGSDEGGRPVPIRSEYDRTRYGSRLVVEIDSADSHFVTCKDSKDWKRK